MNKQADINEYIEALKLSRKFSSQIVCHETIDPQPASYKSTVEPLLPETTRALKDHKISDLYTHQAEALDLIRSGSDVVVATPTASGKSMIYNIPVLEAYCERLTHMHCIYSRSKHWHRINRKRLKNFLQQPAYLLGKAGQEGFQLSMMAIRNRISGANCERIPRRF